MNRTCTLCSTTFEISDHELALYSKLCIVTPDNDIPFGPPTLCPQHRLQRRWSFRNERNLYRTTCAVSGKSIISFLPPTSPYKIIDQSEWWNLSWDGTEYGVPYDFSKPFFQQFSELLKRVPHFNLQNVFSTGENCDYTNHTGNIKECYMLFDSCDSQDCHYSEMLGGCNSCIDCTNCYYCECVANSVDSTRCYGASFLNNCFGCSDSAFLYDCKGCHHCFSSVGLRNQSYVWCNEVLSREEYERRWSGLQFGSTSELKKIEAAFEQQRLSYPRRYASLTQCESCTGNALTNSARAYHSFDGMSLQDVHYTISGLKLKDSLDIEHAESQELCREVISAGQGYRVLFTVMPAQCAEVSYSYNVSNVKRSFGCASLKNQEYCILNKKYPANAYYDLLPRIAAHMRETGEWGEFFPISISPFGYNDTLAQQAFPLSEKEALHHGYPWCSYVAPEATLISRPGSELPDERPDDCSTLRGSVVSCLLSGRLFRLTAQELRHYEKFNLPLPRFHPEERFKLRVTKRNLRALFTRSCARCRTEIESCYSLDSPEIVLCEECYLKDK